MKKVEKVQSVELRFCIIPVPNPRGATGSDSKLTPVSSHPDLDPEYVVLEEFKYPSLDQREEGVRDGL